MFLIWWSLLIQIIVLTFTNNLIADNISIIIVFVLFHTILTILVLYTGNTKYRMLFIIAFLLRFSVMIWNIYFSTVAFDSGINFDSIGFYKAALNISENINLITSNIYGGVYSKILGVLFYFVGPSRLLAQYLNLLMSVTVLYVVLDILIKLRLNTKNIYLIMILTSFFPNSIIMSIILTREIVITLFVTMSLRECLDWINEKNNKKIFTSYIYLCIASMFHSGVIAIALGYSVTYLFYSHDENKFIFNFKTIRTFIILLVIGIVSIILFDELIFSKFKFIDSIDDIYNRVGVGGGLGESSYLTGIEINNFYQFIVYGPLKMIYFISSPVPWNWRGLADVFIFLIDSFFYSSAIFYYLLNIRKIKTYKYEGITLFISILLVSFVFGLGVSNAGTALRHRHKIITLFIIIVGIVRNENMMNEKNVT